MEEKDPIKAEILSPSPSMKPFASSDGVAVNFHSDQGSNSFDYSDFGRECEVRTPEINSVLDPTIIEGNASGFLEDAMRPIPHAHKCKMMPFGIVPAAIAYDGSQMKPSLPILPTVKRSFVPTPPATHQKSTSSSLCAQQIISLNPLPMKKHGCGRPPIRVCSEEEFLRDVIQFPILRGYSRLVPQGGITEFPDAILNGKRLDLYKLYGEVVSRGGFYVGNGINWKGQVFSKMRNHTVSNRMTGVGNTLKRHYETYLLEYELAHDDVDGECCLLCNSSAPGDWVNCGL